MKPARFNDFSGGINQHTSPELIKNNQSPLMVDCSLDQDGDVAHRLGTTLVNGALDSVNKVYGLGVYDKSTGTHTQFVVEGTNLYYDNAGTYTLATGGGGLFGATSTVEFENYLDRMYFVGSGSTEYLKYVTSGTSGVTTVSGNIQGKYLAVANSRMLVAGGTTYPQRVYYSNVGTDTFTTASDYFDLDEPVVALRSFGESNPFIACSANSTYVFDPISRYSRKISKDIGCVNHRTLQILQGRAIWLGRDGIYILAPNEPIPTKISLPVENSLTLDAVFSRITSTGFTNAAALAFNNKYYLSVGDLGATVKGQTLDDCWIVYDIAQKTMSIRTYTANGVGAVFTKWVNTSGNEVALVGSRDNAAIYRLDVDNVYTDMTSTGVATAITALFRTKHFDFGELQQTLLGMHAKIYASAALTVKYAKDGDISYTNWTTTNTTAAGKDWHRELVLPFRESNMKTLSIEFSGTGKWILYSLALDTESQDDPALVPI